MKAGMFFPAAVLAGLVMTGWLYFEGNAYAQGQPSTSQPDTEAPQLSTNAPPPPGFATRADLLNSLTTEKEILNAYHAGLITKDEAAQALVNLGDKESMDTYGKVVDQDGQPVGGVKIRAALESRFGDDKEYDATTDAQGLFHFLRLHGTGLDIIPEKEGYDFDPKLPCGLRPELYVPDPKNPLIITMWKRHGGEPMEHIQIDSDVPCDGGVKKFDLLSNTQNGTGDLIVKLTRNPLNVVRRKPFNWSVTLEVTNGGIQDVTDLYPNEAPENGYQPVMTLDFPTNMVGWQSNVKRAYYFKSKGGQVYGRMAIHVRADRPQPPTYFDAEIYANPTGSRNLEFDPAKQIIR
jgi:hypothetical protein